MAIKFSKYIDITSGVGGQSPVRARDLIGRIFTINPLLPPHSFVEFMDADSVADYFGSTSEEYKRALFYFSWISKNIVRAKKISFARYVDADVEPRIYGAKGDQSLGSWTSITAGTFSLTLGADTNTVGPIDFSAAASISAVAGLIEDAVQAETGTMWTSATVTWDAARKSFNLVGGVAGDAAIAVAAGSGGSDIADQMGWLSPTTILAEGADQMTLTDTMIESAGSSNNFGSFLFIPTLTQTEIVELATWNNGENVLYQYCVPVTLSNYAAIFAAIEDLGGNELVLTDRTTYPDEYDEMFPMIILAATDYTKRNSVQNYMFQQFELTPKVTTTALSDLLDAARVNYYGRTQQAGTFLDFTQRGVMCGLATDPIDMNVYANEQWLKDSAGVELMSLLLSLAKVSANQQGRSQILTTLQTTIQQALFNGAISVGKPLSTIQKLYIAEVTGDELAWHQVQNIGYWLDCVMQSYVTSDNRTEWKAVYTLVYSKDDVIRKVEGTHILI